MIKARLNGIYLGKPPDGIIGLTLRCIKVTNKHYTYECINNGGCREWFTGEIHTVESSEFHEEYWREITFDLYLEEVEQIAN